MALLCVFVAGFAFPFSPLGDSVLLFLRSMHYLFFRFCHIVALIIRFCTLVALIAFVPFVICLSHNHDDYMTDLERSKTIPLQRPRLKHACCHHACCA